MENYLVLGVYISWKEVRPMLRLVKFLLLLLLLPVVVHRSTAAATHHTTNVPTAKSVLDVIDISSIVSNSNPDVQQNYEYSHAVAALAGLANRDLPALYVIATDTDVQWLTYITQSQLPSPWLAGYSLNNFSSVDVLIAAYWKRRIFSGIVLYDPDVFSTSLVASTAAGALDLLPVCGREDSSLFKLVVETLEIPVKLDLRGRFTGNVSGSAKNDALRWAVQQFLSASQPSSPSANGAFLGYYVDYFWTTVAPSQPSVPYVQHTVLNHDYFIAKRGFFFDLDPWSDDYPNDDPKQPLGTDFETLLMIFAESYRQHNGTKMAHLGGFPPWAFKYITASHGGVATEWQFAKVATSYNIFMDADACCIGNMANAALYSLYKLPPRVVGQNPAPTVASLVAQGLVTATPPHKPLPGRMYSMFYAGDWDSAAWTYYIFRQNFDDPNRGKVKIGWALDPSTSQRFPLIFDYVYQRLTPMDRVITGDSGYGYINPTELQAPRFSNLPSASLVWKQLSASAYRQLELDFTGFLINGAAGGLTAEALEMYCDFSSWGMVTQEGYTPPLEGTCANGSTPVFFEIDLPQGGGQAGAELVGHTYQQWKSSAPQAGVTFRVFRGVLRSATYYKEVADQAGNATGGNVVFVDPLELSLLWRLWRENGQL